MSILFKSFLVGTGALCATVFMILIAVPLCGDTFQTSMFVNSVIGCYLIGSTVSYYCMKQTEEYKAALKREEDLHFQLQSTHDQLKIRSRLDMMTGLLNRETFLAEMESAKSKCSDRTCSVVLLDVDHFKRINDTWGHHAGDEALVQIGASILAVFGPESCAGRIGGEEFAIFLPCEDGAEAAVLGEAIRFEVAQIPFLPTPSCSERLTVSVGVASASSVIDTKTLLKLADSMLYQAKADGRNRVSVNPTIQVSNSEPMTPLLVERRMASHELRAAIN